jgi:tetratricopeptide (TPR) repeat protein
LSNRHILILFILVTGIAGRFQSIQGAEPSIINSRELAEQGAYDKALSVLVDCIKETNDAGLRQRCISQMVLIGLASQDAGVSFVNKAQEAIAVLSGENRAYLHYHLGRKVASLGDFKRSNQILKTGIVQADDVGWTWCMEYEIGMNLYSQEAYREAADHFGSMWNSGHVPDMYKYVLGTQYVMSLSHSSQWEKVIEISEQLVDGAPNDIRVLDILDHLSLAYRKSGDIHSAIRTQEIFVELWPKIMPDATPMQAGRLKTMIGKRDRLTRQEGIVLDALDETMITIDIAPRPDHGGLNASLPIPGQVRNHDDVTLQENTSSPSLVSSNPQKSNPNSSLSESWLWPSAAAILTVALGTGLFVWCKRRKK